MSDELKPCPFCGSPAEMRHFSGPRHSMAVCTGCGAALPVMEERDAEAAWNRRAREVDHDGLLLLADRIEGLAREGHVPSVGGMEILAMNIREALGVTE